MIHDERSARSAKLYGQTPLLKCREMDPSSARANKGQLLKGRCLTDSQCKDFMMNLKPKIAILPCDALVKLLHCNQDAVHNYNGTL